VGNTRRIFASASSTAGPAIEIPVCRLTMSPSTTAVASSSVSISGGSLNPGRNR
jgi:hypothetical protein